MRCHGFSGAAQEGQVRITLNMQRVMRLRSQSVRNAKDQEQHDNDAGHMKAISNGRAASVLVQPFGVITR
eukprot:6469938-Amphidinium_carterae.3